MSCQSSLFYCPQFRSVGCSSLMPDNHSLCMVLKYWCTCIDTINMMWYNRDTVRVLICGDRNWTNSAIVADELCKIRGVSLVIEGEARGADTLGKLAARAIGIPVLPFPAKWKQYGIAAGPIRNQQMLDEGRPDIVLAFHSNLDKSKGTADMVRRATKAGIPVKIFTDVDTINNCML